MTKTVRTILFPLIFSSLRKESVTIFLTFIAWNGCQLPNFVSICQAASHFWVILVTTLNCLWRDYCVGPSVDRTYTVAYGYFSIFQLLLWTHLFIRTVERQIDNIYNRLSRKKEKNMHTQHCWLHFAWVVDNEKCIVVTRVCVCVCLSVCPRPYAHTIARTRM